MYEVLKTYKARTEKSMVGVRLRTVFCQTLVYADDVDRIANSKRKLQQTVTEWADNLSERGVTISHKNRQVMIVARSEEVAERITRVET